MRQNRGRSWPGTLNYVALSNISFRPRAALSRRALAYFFGRLVYLPLYAAGVPVIRGLVWNIPTLGILAMFATLLPYIS